MEIEGFRVHRIKQIPEEKLQTLIWWRQHKIRAHHHLKPMDRTLFIGMMPDSCKIEHNLMLLMSQFGEVERILYQESPAHDNIDYEMPYKNNSMFSNNVAFVVFKKAKYLRKVLQLSLEESLIISQDESCIRSPFDYPEYLDDAGLIAVKEADTRCMEEYALTEREAEDKRDKAAQQDEEGWQTVTKKYKPNETGGALKTKISLKRLKKQKKYEMVNFYAFQHREKKAQQWAHWKREYEQNKKNISEAISARKFKPL